MCVEGGGALSSSISRRQCCSAGRLDDKVRDTLCVPDSCGLGGATVSQVGGLTPDPVDLSADVTSGWDSDALRHLGFATCVWVSVK